MQVSQYTGSVLGFRFQVRRSRVVRAKTEQDRVLARNAHAAWLAWRFPSRVTRGFRGSRNSRHARAWRACKRRQAQRHGQTRQAEACQVSRHLQQSVQMLCEATRLDAGRPTVLHLSDLGRSSHGLKGRGTVGRPASSRVASHSKLAGRPHRENLEVTSK